MAEEAITFGVDVEIRDALKAMNQFNREMNKTMSGVSKAIEGMNKTNTKASEEAIKHNEEMLDGVEDLTKAQNKYGKVIAELKTKSKKADGARKVAIDQQLNLLEDLNKAEIKAAKAAGGGGGATIDLKGAKKGAKIWGKEFGAATKSAFSSFMGKDARGLAQTLGKDLVPSLAKGLKGAIGGIGGGIGAAGGGLKGAGARLGGRGVAKGGAGGMAMRGGGAAMKGIGSVMKGMAPLIKSFSALIPVLKIASQAIMGLVTMFIDAEGQAKAFQKEILQSASTAEFMGKGARQAEVAMVDLGDAVKGIRNAARGSTLEQLKFNDEWNASADVHKSIINTLTQEGVSLKQISIEAKRAYPEIEKLDEQSAKFSQDLIKTSVAYTRQFGVAMNEVGQLQAELMTEVGQSAGEVDKSFAQMVLSAGDAGIASNKFFAMIRGVAADLSLFNLRIGAAAKFLGQVGKAMSPRNAEKFFQSVVGFFKGQDLGSRIKTTMMAGQGTTKKILQKDVQRKVGGLAGDVDRAAGKGTGKELIAAFKEGPQATARFIAKHGDKLSGAMRESILDAQRMQAKVERGGLVDLASALKDVDPMGAIQELEAISMKHFGKPMDKLTNMELHAFTQLTSTTDEQLDQFSKFRSALDITREEIAARLESGKGTEEDRALLEKMGIQGTDAEKAEAIRNADSARIWEDMSAENRKKLTTVDKSVKDFAKDQTKLQQSLLDRLGILVDFIMNEFYNLIVSILDALPFGGAADAAKKARMTQDIMKTGNTELLTAMRESKTLAEFHGKAIMSKTGREFGSTLSGAGAGKATERVELATANIAKLEKALSKGEDDTGGRLTLALEAARKEQAAAETAKQSVTKKRDDARKKVDANLGGKGGEDRTRAARLVMKTLSGEKIGAVGKVGQGERGTEAAKKKAALFTNIAEGGDIAGALKEAGLNEKEIGKFYAKAMWRLSPQQAGGIITGQAKSGGGQAAAAKKSAGTGKPGGGQAAELASAEGGAPAGKVSVVPDKTQEAIASSAKTNAEVAENTAQLETLEPALNEQKEIRKKLSKVRLDTGFLKGPFASETEKSMLNALRVALLEFALIQAMDPKKLAAAIQADEIDPRTYGQEVFERTGESGVIENIEEGKKTAKGGFIVGMGPDGVAKVLTPPAGEFPSYVGAGETIVPKGGGGGGGAPSVHITINGPTTSDMARAMETTARNTYQKELAKRGLTG